jgi:cytochrome c551/c552
MKIACCFTVLVAVTFGAGAAPQTIKLPEEVAKLRPSDLPGAKVAARACVVCHSADYINYQPPGMSLTQWTGEVAKMQHTYGAPITDNEVKLIGAYLAVAYGSAKPDDADVIAASATAPAPTNAVASIDVKALLNANGCLACHAIDKKVVGPAYHDVAAKYSHDTQAAAMLAKRILEGSSGRWGEVPMPPNAGLDAEQAKALAEFVLKQ